MSSHCIGSFPLAPAYYLPPAGCVTQPLALAHPNDSLLLAEVISLTGAEDLTFDWAGDLHVTAYYDNAVNKYNGTSGEFLMSYGKGVVRGPVRSST